MTWGDQTLGDRCGHRGQQPTQLGVTRDGPRSAALRDTWLLILYSAQSRTGSTVSAILSNPCPTRFHCSTMQTPSPRYAFGLPDKKSLNDAFVGKPIASLRTPALVIDRATFAENCARMHQNVTTWGAEFRAHIKTHKVRPQVSGIWLGFLTFTRRPWRAPNFS